MAIAWRGVAVGDFRGAACEYVRCKPGLVWRYDAQLAGLAISGSSYDDFMSPVPAFLALAEHATSRFDLVTDVSRLEISVANATALSVTHDQFGGFMRVFSPVMRRQAGLVARNWSAPYWKSINATAGAPWELETFFEPAELWAWLGVDTAIAATVDELVDEVLSTPDPSALLINALTEVLRIEPGLGVAEAARRTGTSQRTLQRMLTAVGARFADIRGRVRLERAVTLMADPALKIEVVAGAIGFYSTAHFTTWFRRHHGMTPSQFRETRAQRN